MPVSIEWSISCCRVIRLFFLVGLASSLLSVAADDGAAVGVDDAAGVGMAAVGAGEAAGADDAAGAGVAAAAGAGVGVGVVAVGAGVAGAAAAGGASVPAAGGVWANARPAEKVATTVAAKAAEIREYSFIRHSGGTSPAVIESLAAGFWNGR